MQLSYFQREKWFKELIFDGSDENSEYFDITRWSAYGSAYNFWSYEAIKWMRRDRRIKNFLESEMVKRAYSPDEYVWATLNRNPNCPGTASLPGAQIFCVFFTRGRSRVKLSKAVALISGLQRLTRHRVRKLVLKMFDEIHF